MELSSLGSNLDYVPKNPALEEEYQGRKKLEMMVEALEEFIEKITKEIIENSYKCRKESMEEVFFNKEMNEIEYPTAKAVKGLGVFRNTLEQYKTALESY